MPRLQNLAVEYVSLVDRAAVRDPMNPSEPQKFLLWKAERGATNDPEGGTMTEAEQSAALKKAEDERDAAVAERDEAVAKNEKLEKKLKKASKDDPEPTEIDKSELPPAVRDALEKAEKREQEANERIEKAETIAKEERDQRITREFVVKAEAIPHVAGDTAEFGKVLKSASELLSKEEFELLEQRLSAVNEQIDKGELFKQLGRSGDAERDSGEDAIARKAEELKKADSSLSDYDAMVLASRGEAGREHLQHVR